MEKVSHSERVQHFIMVEMMVFEITEPSLSPAANIIVCKILNEQLGLSVHQFAHLYSL